MLAQPTKHMLKVNATNSACHSTFSADNLYTTRTSGRLGLKQGEIKEV